LETDWIEPELRDFVISFNVDVMRLIEITGIKKESIWADPEYSWHFIHYSLTSLFFIIAIGFIGLFFAFFHPQIRTKHGMDVESLKVTKVERSYLV